MIDPQYTTFFDEWPTEPGWYWFDGYITRQAKAWGQRDFKPVRVSKISNGLAYIMDGTFFFKGDATGQWCKMFVPPPKEKE